MGVGEKRCEVHLSVLSLIAPSANVDTGSGDYPAYANVAW